MRATGWAAMTVLVVAVGVGTPVGARPAGAIRLGVLGGMFRDVPPPVIQAAAEPFRDLFKRQTGLGSEVEVIDDHAALARKLQAKELHLGVFHGFEWAWVRDQHPDLIPLAVTVPPRRPQACLVVNADSKALTPSDLKGKCVTVPLATKAHCYLFLERLAETLPAGCCLADRLPESGPNEVLDAVVDGKATAALMDSAALAAYQNNLPGRGAKLRVLAESDPFPPTVVVYRKDALAEADAAKIRSGLLRTKDEASGRAFLFLWKLKGFEDVPAGYDAELRTVAKAYPAPRPAMTAMPE
jgi:ABC-type phosphate/phosphonate transport system substrate-binding protein